MAAVITIAITLVAGAALYGYVNGEAAASEAQLGNAAAGNANFLSEQFVIVQVDFQSSTCASNTLPCIRIWIYNNGQVTLQLSSVLLTDSQGKVDILYNFTSQNSPSCSPSPPGSTMCDWAWDLLSSTPGSCKVLATTTGGGGQELDLYESPSISKKSYAMTTLGMLELNIPPQQGQCPSFGQTFVSGDTYYVRLVGIYGNSVTYYVKR
jgi:archaellum component FlaF (FlaF/FlaG flagellin family)